MNWSTLVKVARFQLVDRTGYIILPWAILAFDFLVNLALIASWRAPHAPAQTGACAAIYLFFMVVGALSIFQALPFALSLGVSRRSYYAGTALLAIGLAVVYGLALAVLQVIERATGGWGVSLRFFRVYYILPGPWYLTWLTSFVGLTLMFVYGMWVGLVYRRWNLPGLVVFFAAQATLAVAGVIAAARASAWPAIGHFFTTLSAAGLTGLLAALAAVLLAGGYATMRHVTV
ncbi:MAG TPA: hypothetical protein VEL03_18585 [Streptosporangiaceae bacterium]|nr:hypothetical protein [Streptosporangiaceae bacterium]